MVITAVILFTLLAAGAGALAVRTVFRAVGWILRLVRLLLGVTLLAATVFYYFPGLYDKVRNNLNGARE